MDAIDAGDILIRGGTRAHAGLRQWTQAAQFVRAQLPSEIRTLYGADHYYATAGAITSWLGAELQAALLDHVAAHHCLAQEGRAALLALVERFSDELAAHFGAGKINA